MQAVPSRPRSDVLGATVRRLLRRGGRARISKMLAKVRPEDVAVMLRSFTPSEQLAVFEILFKDFSQSAGEVLVKLDPEARQGIFKVLSPEQVARMLAAVAVDDAVFLLDSLPADLEEQVLQIVDIEERFAAVQQRLAYADDTAGRIMDSEFVALQEEVTASEAIARVRQIAHEVDMISYLYVVDQAGRLIGVAPLRQLLLADPEQTLGQIMNAAVIKVHADTDQEEVAKLAARYDLLAIPVTDDQGKLIGIVTIDDIVDVFKEEANEDFFKMAGTSENELIYQDRPFRVALIRLPWILFNLIGLLVVGFLVFRFEETFQLAVMVAFIPVVMGMAGNIGSQTSTISVRGLATGRLSFGQGRVRRFLWQQLKVGTVLGALCSAVVVGVTVLLGGGRAAVEPLLALVIGLALFSTVLLASTIGVLIPVLFQRIGFDPAIASGPLVTTANDLLGVTIYFGLATFFLQVLG
jgi:magnesium transporter